MNRLVLVLCILVCWLAPGWAAAAPARRLLIHVEGPASEEARADLVAILPKSVEVVDPSTAARAMADAGLRTPMGNAMAVEKLRGGLLERAAKAGDAVHAGATLLARVRRTRSGGRELWIVWLDAGSSQPKVDEPASLDGDEAARRTAIRSTIGAALDALAPAGDEPTGAAGDPPAAAPAREATRDEAPRTERALHQAGTAIVDVSAAFRMAGRRFSYSDALPDERAGDLRSYSVTAPMAAARLELFPAASTGAPVARDLGLVGSYARAFAVRATTSDGREVSSTYDRFGGGLRLRVRTGGPTAPVLGISGQVQRIRFAYDDAPMDLAKGLPDVSYTVLRAGLDARIFVASRVAVLLALAYLAPLEHGEVYDRLRDPRVAGLEADLGLAFPLTGAAGSSGFEVRLDAAYTRFWSSFTPVPGDAYVAGGALDHLFDAGLGVAWIY